ncbi:MAG TPA: SWIM zinc finger family protein [Planctomicrobium sp.]|nr:SWIM zinc finger family protein [Planctomicrobium sp.]
MYWDYPPYVSAAEKRAKALRYAQKLEKKGVKLQPIQIEGRAIAKTFWGKAWCNNLERYSDYENRLPRGRTYARNGSIIDLQIHKGKIKAIVQGSSIYNVTIDLTPLDQKGWKKIVQDCSQSIHSLLDLLQGRLSDGVMERLVRPKEGLFPQPKEIKIRCSCPDWADLCKHSAAVLYGVGARLDKSPDLLFLLRQVDQAELVSSAVGSENLKSALGSGNAQVLQNEELGELFGIDLEESSLSPAPSKKAIPKNTKSLKAHNESAKPKATQATRTTTVKSKVKPTAAAKKTDKVSAGKPKPTSKAKAAKSVKPASSPASTTARPKKKRVAVKAASKSKTVSASTKRKTKKKAASKR